MSNIFSSQINAGDTFSFQIINFLSPPTNEPVDSIKITSYTNISSSSYKINTCTDYVTGLIPNVISSISITNSANTSLTVNKVYTIRFAFDTVDTFYFTDYF